MPEPDFEVVVDTNVVVKFFIEESDSDKADVLLESVLLGNIRLVVPDFLFIEFANVLWIKTLREGLTETEALEKIAQLIALSSLMETIPSREILVESFQASRNYEQAAYEAAFVALAESRSIPFVTADEKLYRKIRSRSKTARLLSDWQA